MPNKWTFTIKPIKEFLKQEVKGGLWVDPFAGLNSPAQVRNDLNPDMPAEYHMDALEFLRIWNDEHFEGALYDPPYSYRQASECYQSFGKEKFTAVVTSMDYWSKCKDEITRIVKPGGKVLCFGWNSMGIGINRNFKMTKVLLVPHGGSKNDTICTVEEKSFEVQGSLEFLNREGKK